jgi:hypothetical protein
MAEVCSSSEVVREVLVEKFNYGVFKNEIREFIGSERTDNKADDETEKEREERGIIHIFQMF